MKKVKLEKVLNLKGKQFALPERDEYEQIILDDKQLPKIKRTDSLLDMLEYFILYGIPRQKYTKNDAIRVGNIYRSITTAREAKNGVMEIDEAEHDWLKSKLQDDEIGVRMLTYDMPVILEALDNFERKQSKAGE